MTGTRLAAKARRTARAVLRLAPLTITGFMQFSWFGSLVVSSDPYAIVRRDWHQFFLTGHQLLSGDLSAIYPRTFESAYFSLYPPYCIYLTAPLGVLPEWWAYALCVVLETIAGAGRHGPGRRDDGARLAAPRSGAVARVRADLARLRERRPEQRPDVEATHPVRLLAHRDRRYELRPRSRAALARERRGGARGDHAGMVAQTRLGRRSPASLRPDGPSRGQRQHVRLLLRWPRAPRPGGRLVGAARRISVARAPRAHRRLPARDVRRRLPEDLPHLRRHQLGERVHRDLARVRGDRSARHVSPGHGTSVVRSVDLFRLLHVHGCRTDDGSAPPLARARSCRARRFGLRDPARLQQRGRDLPGHVRARLHSGGGGLSRRAARLARGQPAARARPRGGGRAAPLPARLAAGPGGGRLGRHPVAAGARRARREPPRADRLHRGDGARTGARDPGPGERQHRRPDPHPLRHAGAAGALAAAHASRRPGLVSRLLGAERGLRPGLAPLPRAARRRPLGGQRAEGVVEQGALRRLVPPPRAQRP